MFRYFPRECTATAHTAYGYVVEAEAIESSEVPSSRIQCLLSSSAFNRNEVAFAVLVL